MIQVRTDVPLLCLQHGLVLIKGATNALADVVAQVQIVELELPHHRPEVMRRCFCLGREQVQHLALECAAFVVRSGWRRAILDDVKSWWGEMVGVPAIDATSKSSGAPVERRRF